jgi:hypothetical protein
MVEPTPSLIETLHEAGLCLILVSLLPESCCRRASQNGFADACYVPDWRIQFRISKGRAHQISADFRDRVLLDNPKNGS